MRIFKATLVQATFVSGNNWWGQNWENLFCTPFLHLVEIRFQILNANRFSDDCLFSVSKELNNHKCHIWNSKPSQQVEEIPVNSPSVTVWCSFSQNELAGSHFFIWKRYGTELYEHALLLGVSKTLNIFGVYEISTEYCYSSLCVCCTSVPIPKAFRPLDRKSSFDFLASALARFDSFKLHFVKISGKLRIPWALCNHIKTKKDNLTEDLNRW